MKKLIMILPKDEKKRLRRVAITHFGNLIRLKGGGFYD